MKSIKPLFVLFLLISFNQAVLAQYRVKETSEKNIPDWVNENTPGLIVVKGTGATVDESRNKACKTAQENILRIALKNLSAHTYYKDKEYGDEGAKIILSRSEYIKNIGPEAIKAFYWEKHYYKKTKTVQFEYTVQYPVDTITIKLLVDDLLSDYEILEKASTRIMLSKNIDELKKIWQDLMSLNFKFPDSEKRKVDCDILINQLGEKFEAVQIKEMLNIPGKLIVAQTINERGILSGTEPSFISPCAKIISTDNYLDEWRIDYSYDNCPTNSPLKITVEFDNGYNKKSEEFTVDLKQIHAEIKLSETKITIKDNKSITIYISSRYRGDVILDRIVLKYNDINITDTKLNQVLDGAGLYNIDFTLPPGFETVKLDDGIRGELHYTLKINGQKGVFRFYNHKAKRN